MLESAYQAKLIKKLEKRFPGCLVLKNDSGYRQGIPDLTVLHENHWAVLEVKKDADAEQQPNQEHYVSRANAMSFGAFIYPENEKEVLDALQRSFQSGEPPRVSKS